ncbi:di-heme-cytochrome C peroxidase [Allorhodopirellula heiligendammensis]|uniref:Cytochrome c domain-containing protein n=1 Tax=Allorhodopirellula heiligendammensis TaxID=2714739 RepID=A0A5C6BWA4_9BACT|nr:di-heme-cytochrome C peroxidase [Allorhodopirellula heiligendammensis]TWU16278.1 hypothetical protein Poly21_34830 [Allorhodopirellula heiligendammensis]
MSFLDFLSVGPTAAPLGWRSQLFSSRRVLLAIFLASSASALVTADGPPQKSPPDPSRPTAMIVGKSAFVSIAPADRYTRSALPVKFLEQNWSADEAVEFYSLRQGSPLMRRDFFNILEQPDGVGLFRDSDYLASFGFLPRRPHEGNIEGYPVGFTGDRAIELTCAACHTSKMTFEGTEYWIDGSQAMTDMESFLTALTKSLKLTFDDAPDLSGFTSNVTIRLDQQTRFGRFVRQLTGGDTLRVSQAQVIFDLLQSDYQRRQRYNDYNDFGRLFSDDTQRQSAEKHPAYGFGRLDALGAILNQSVAEIIDKPGNAATANAPVNYPEIWDAPQHRHVQWNGSVDNSSRFGPLSRNAGQVVGVFGLVKTEGTTVGYDSSINFDALARAEELVTKLWSPPWPSEFGLDNALAAEGETVYRANCIQCHDIIDRTSRHRRANEVLVPINLVFGPNGTLGTDPMAAKNWRDRQAKVGILAGRNRTIPFAGKFPSDPQATVPAREVLTHLVYGTILRSFVPWRDELTIDDTTTKSFMLAPIDSGQSLMQYKARPLNGVWSTSPYLHNGSVLNMAELLKPPAARTSTFNVGTTEFDPVTLGYRNAGPFEFHTSENGNANSGHEYGTSLNEREKSALIEFIKTL